MDIVLELLDGLVFDRLYATILPASGKLYDNSTQAAGGRRLPYHYEPASQYLSLAPGKYVDMSVLPRDNAWRQLSSLYMMTW